MKKIGLNPLSSAERQKRRRAKMGAAAAYAYKRKWEKANPEKAKATKWKTSLKKYGLTPASYNEMWISQDRKCAICRSDDPRTQKGWHVDHCHSTGVVRGILCTRCNSMLGGAVDRIENLLRGVEYLKRSIKIVRAA